MKTLHFFIFESQIQNALSWASVYFPLSFSFRNHAIHLVLHYNRTAICIYVVRKMSHFVLKQIADERKPFISCLLTVITRALITPNHWHPGSGKWQQKHQRIDVALLLWQILRISNHSIFFLWLLFSSLMVEKNKTNKTNMHTVKIAECLLLFHSQFDGENMYMSMTEPSQDYVPASQVG